MKRAKKLLEDPALFVRHFLNRKLWYRQEEILRSVAAHRRTAVKACHASGKTFVAAAAVLWWITTRPKGIAITTAPTWTQIERVIWPEIHRLALNAKIAYPKPSLTKLDLGDGRFAMGLSTNEGVRFQGFHGNILIILDEAPGILPEIYEAIGGIQAGGDVRVLALGNPVIASGPFFDAFSANRTGWNLISISAFDCPNLMGVTLEQLLTMCDEQLDDNCWPSLTTRRWVRDRYIEWGPRHPLWESRVCGNFPQQSDDALFSLTWLEQAKNRTEGDGDFHAGVDVAGPGEDETVVCVRQGPRIIALRGWSGRDARGDVLATLMPFKSRLKSVNVDSVGIGEYFSQYLRDHGLRVSNINAGGSPRNKDKYVNRKAEVYWQFHERVKAGDLAGLTDDKAIAQLASIRYGHNHRGQIEIESKEDARKRGVKSPDRAEAVILAFAEAQDSFQGWLDYYAEEAEEARKARPSGHVWQRRNGIWW
jgi:hypothetical protein